MIHYDPLVQYYDPLCPISAILRFIMAQYYVPWCTIMIHWCNIMVHGDPLVQYYDPLLWSIMVHWCNIMIHYGRLVQYYDSFWPISTILWSLWPINAILWYIMAHCAIVLSIMAHWCNIMNHWWSFRLQCMVKRMNCYNNQGNIWLACSLTLVRRVGQQTLLIVIKCNWNIQPAPQVCYLHWLQHHL